MSGSGLLRSDIEDPMSHAYTNSTVEWIYGLDASDLCLLALLVGVGTKLVILSVA